MEKISCVALYNASIMIEMPNVEVSKYSKLSGKVETSNSFKEYADLGMFTYKKDAFLAIEVYKKILEAAEMDNIKPCEESKIDRKIFPEKEMSARYYNNIAEFVKDNLMIAKCKKIIGDDKVNKILVDLGAKMNPQQERIVERMISDYICQSEDKNIKHANPKAIVNYKENVKFLEDLQSGKISFNQ